MVTSIFVVRTFYLLWLGRRHPVIDDPSELTPGRRKLGFLAGAVRGCPVM